VNYKATFTLFGSVKAFAETKESICRHVGLA